MPTGLLPTPADARDDATLDDPRQVVEDFLAALAEPDLGRAGSLLAEDVAYTNVGLPTVHGAERVMSLLAGMDRPGWSFEAYLHAISADGPVVLTERTDVIAFRRLRSQFWVWGRFEVHDGRITVWRDSFDYLDITRSLLRGIAGTLVASLRPAPPRPGDPPGR